MQRPSRIELFIAIVVWRDRRGSDYDFYGQRINPTGDRLWPSGAPTDSGAVVCDLSHAQFNPSVTPDGSGGIVVAWNDSRNSATTNTDIYAHKIFDDVIFDDGFETGDTGEWDAVFP